MKAIIDWLNHNVVLGAFGSEIAGIGGAWYCTLSFCRERRKVED